eukprot:TRINITY_DN11676_c0_g1_i1.p1 TRINITY_DN11676_c0_g1~~TRINITY_DN11676_c0_g1_i1.p1  ORF type:complete len:235 (+),score=24.37 TRINITY_DN11676_c0_g1_i1:390-1094(+)
MEESKHWTINEVPCKEYVAGCEVHHKELKYGSVNLHLVQCGNLEGELVLLLHGFPNFWYAWKNQLNMLKSAGYHIIAPDLRGYNASSQPVDVMSYSRRNINADLISLIQYFNLGKPTNIVGHDWGGTVALCFAEDNPDLVRRLVVVNAPHLEQMKNLLMTSPRQLLRSWYMFFIQIPWLPEWCLSLDRFNALRKSLPASFPVEDVDKHHIGQCGTILKILTASFYMLSIETTEL